MLLSQVGINPLGWLQPMRPRIPLNAVLLTGLCVLEQAAPPKYILTPDVQADLDTIRADSLRGDLSFIASDALDGRDTPSPGLDIAAEYIASQFRRAGLDPAGDDGYFQTARMVALAPNSEGFEITLGEGEHSFAAAPTDVVLNLSAALDLKETPIFKLDLGDSGFIEGLTPGQLKGKVVLTEFKRNAMRNYRTASRVLRSARPAAIIVVDRTGATGGSPGEGHLADPEQRSTASPQITLLSAAASDFYASLKAGASDTKATIHVAAPQEKPVKVRNVIGILRGSDPDLQDTAVLLTAHYDHLGERADHRIYNGANDDGSGTVSVMEVARALSALKPHPRRSIVFMAFFGEEKGLMGSRYYVRHPLWPIEKTIAQLNLEQLGRTDSTEGPQIANATMTGFDFSSVGEYLRRAGELTGIKIYKNARESDLYFNASDNYSLAEAGIPAHTVTVAFNYPDYHAVGDEWQKIDYDNMAKVDRAVALTAILLADGEQPPHWNESDRKAAPYLKAWKQHHQ
jgi:Zn-dependent M28 family amino/carboxypeptidase